MDVEQFDLLTKKLTFRDTAVPSNQDTLVKLNYKWLIKPKQ